MSRVTEPAGRNPGPRPFVELPFALAKVAEWALEDNSFKQIDYDGMTVIMMADTYIDKLSAEDYEANIDKAWKVERADGRVVYIWAHGLGAYGQGKPSVA